MDKAEKAAIIANGWNSLFNQTREFDCRSKYCTSLRLPSSLLTYSI